MPALASLRRAVVGFVTITVAALVAVLVSPAPAAAQRWRDTSLSIDARVTALRELMTREEKFWQLFMTPGDLDTPTHDWSHGVYGLQVRMPAGTPQRGIARAQAARVDSIQQFFVTRTRSRNSHRSSSSGTSR